jgi:hypothetical protein
MALEDTLRGMREASQRRIPADKAAVMHRATEELRAPGIMDRVIKAGDPLPPFALPNAYGRELRSADLLAKGPLVLSFFRGSW